MADGKSHGQITTGISIVTSPIVLIVTHSLFFTAFYIAGCLLGMIIEPDLDINHITESEKRIINKLGIFGYIWVGLWLPYALILPHRSIFSHVPILGTTIRVVYLYLWVLFIARVINIDDIILKETISNINFWEWSFLGLIMSDIGHWIADWTVWRNKWIKNKN